MTFRWHYWVGAARVLREHPVLGVGWNNFGYHYLSHRLPQAPEEVKDPHNFLVRFFVELGLVGGLLLMAWLVLLWWEMTRPMVPCAGSPQSDSEGGSPGVVKYVAAVA